jgi:peptide/nickel transport system permease protein
MAGFIARRLLSGVFLLFVLSSLTYFILFFSTANVARNILGDLATAEQLATKNAELGLDQPLIGRWFEWMLAAAQGDFGKSWFNSLEIVDQLTQRLPITLTLVGVTIILAALLATLLGMAASVRGGLIDKIVQMLAVAGFAIPNFVVAIFLVTLVAIQWKLLPATGWVPFDLSPELWLKSLILPVISIVLATIASSAQQIRSAIKKNLEMDWVRTLRARGLSESEILFKHVLRASAPAGLTVLSLQFVGMLGGTVIIEQIFALPGMGFLAVQSTFLGDTPVVMGVVVYTVIVVIIVNLLVDLANGWLNPKVRVK